MHLAVVRAIRARQVDVAENPAEKIVEVVGNPSGQSAYGFELLCFEPFFFQKAPDSIVTDGVFPYPSLTSDVHHEIELVIAIGPVADTFCYAVGLYITIRYLQAEAKKVGKPWEAAKSFDYSAPISAIVPMTDELKQGAITLDVNDQRRQTADLADLIWNVGEIIAELKKLFDLKAGDLIFTGTPSGVAAISKGDHLHGEIAGLGSLDVDVV